MQKGVRNSLCTDIAVDIIAHTQAVRCDASDAAARVNDLAAADVDTHVPDGMGGIGEKDKVAGLQILLGNIGAAVFILAGRRVRQGIAELTVEIHRKAGAVEPVGAAAAAAIAHAHVLHGHLDNLCTDRGCRAGIVFLQIVTENITGRIAELNVIPAVVCAEYSDELAGRDLRDAVTICARTGAHVDRTADDHALRKFRLGGRRLCRECLRCGGFLPHRCGDCCRSIHQIGDGAVCRKDGL